MSEFKEFQGKTLDEAIQAACSHYDMGRDKLEIEIITGGSSGVFGIVGVRKARIKARSRKAFKTDEIMNGSQEKAPRERKPAQEKAAPKKEQKPKKKAEPKKDKEQEPRKEKAPRKEEAAPKKERKPQQQPKPESTPEPAPESVQERKPEAPAAEKPAPAETEAPKERPNALETLDKAEVESAVRECLGKMLEPIVGEAKLDITFDPDRVKVFIDDEENSGLIIGREGQTLSSLQYLVNRLVSRRMEASVRVQIDTGDYRERQDDKLRQLAEHLAEKAVNQSRTQSTKPLSSYHRRVVHLTLQDNETVFTRSKGDGPLKRVLIVPKRRGGGRRNNARN